MIKYLLIFVLFFSGCGFLEKEQAEHIKYIEGCKTYYPEVTDYGNGVYILVWNSCNINDSESVGYVLTKFSSELNAKGFQIKSISPKYDNLRYHNGFIVIAGTLCK
jgi:hypothetical protein